MIGPIFLRGKYIEKFREHLLIFPYNHVIHEGISCLDDTTKNLPTDKVNKVIDHFVNARFPIFCFAGSKSTIPFWDYHVALDYDHDKKEASITELLVRDPILENSRKGILMAYDFLVNPRVGVERIRVPMNVNSMGDNKDFEDILVEFVPHKNITYLSMEVLTYDKFDQN